MLVAKINPILIPVLLFFISCKEIRNSEGVNALNKSNPLIMNGEKHLSNVRQLTFGGNNAEAYWSFDGKKLVFQSDFKDWGASCDQIFWFLVDQDDLSKNKPNEISKNLGRTTCSYFLPGDSLIVFASTATGGAGCPHVPERKPGGKYVWPIYRDYEIYISDLQGNIIQRMTNNQFYDAEATVSPDGLKMVYTSDKSGDLELYVMDLNGKNEIQITNELGYDGGAFFSPDSKKLVFRASRPKTEEEIKEYKELLEQGLVQPTNMEIYTVNADGTDLKQITHLGKANWAPYFHPSGEKIVFSSNHASTRGFQFNLYMIHTDGTNLEQITFDSVFASFPMFSPDGKRISFSSNRNNGGNHDTNLFVADWVE
ncbi:MAG: PD40 domain-containing protein [Saprospiraceae bacterium]|nr:PD40 domain-containing protein [Saprospiraceae bacterium]